MTLHHSPTKLGDIALLVLCGTVLLAFDVEVFNIISLCIVACHLPEGSKISWREDMCGGLTSAWEPRVG